MPKIDLSLIPGLDSAQAVFGAASGNAGTYNDSVISVMVYVYDTAPPPAAAGLI